jgi:cobalamin-dependent methionine synthase I
MPGLPIEEQRNILDLAHADEIGVSLTASGIMVPRKSTSLIMAIGPNMRTWTQEEVCARCNLRDTCLYKTIR